MHDTYGVVDGGASGDTQIVNTATTFHIALSAPRVGVGCGLRGTVGILDALCC
jgi:hypothetical protein